MTNTNHTAEAAENIADELEEAGDMEGAMKAISRAVDIDRENPKYRALRGRLFYLRGSWRDAVRDFDSALACKPDAATTLYFRARARSMMDDLDGAIADFERCIALEPDSADAFKEIGDIHRYRGELPLALAAYRKAVELDPARLSDLEGIIAAIEKKSIT